MGGGPDRHVEGQGQGQGGMGKGEGEDEKLRRAHVKV